SNLPSWRCDSSPAGPILHGIALNDSVASEPAKVAREHAVRLLDVQRRRHRELRSTDIDAATGVLRSAVRVVVRNFARALRSGVKIESHRRVDAWGVTGEGVALEIPLVGCREAGRRVHDSRKR